mgnify:CR=1 FL=1
MGVSTPKPAFNLAAFLSEKAPAKSRRKPTWSRQAPRAEAEVEVEVAADMPSLPRIGARLWLADEVDEMDEQDALDAEVEAAEEAAREAAVAAAEAKARRVRRGQA